MNKILFTISLCFILIGCDSDSNIMCTVFPDMCEQEENPIDIEPPIAYDYDNPICDSIMYPEGKRGGFLWKPISEKNGNLAVLLPGNFESKFDVCYVVTKSRKVENLEWHGFTNWDGLHDKKPFQTWRGSMPGSEYIWGGTVKCRDSEQECIWQIENPSIRND